MVLGRAPLTPMKPVRPSYETGTPSRAFRYRARSKRKYPRRPFLRSPLSLNLPRHPLRAGITFRGLLVRSRSLTFAAACPFARPPGGSDRCSGIPAHQPTRTLTSALSPGWSPLLTADMTTVLPGRATPAGLSPARTSASKAGRRSRRPDPPPRPTILRALHSHL